MSGKNMPSIKGSPSRVDQLKARLDAVVDADSFPPAKQDDGEKSKQTIFGFTYLFLSVLMLITGMYQPSNGYARSILALCALVFSIGGAYLILRAHRSSGRPPRNTR